MFGRRQKYPLSASEGNVAVSVTANQVVARKSPEKKSILSRDVIPREILDFAPNLIAVLTADGRVVQLNKYAREVLKLSENRGRPGSLYDLCLPAERERVKQLVDECTTSCRTVAAKTELLAGDGTTISVDLSLSPYPPRKRSNSRHCVLVARDISEEKKKELDLLRFSNIAHHTVNPLEITDSQGRIIYVNPAFEKASGYSKEELIGKNPNVFGSGKQPKTFWTNMWKTITSGNVWVGEVENRRRNGDPFFTQLLISPIIDGENTVVGYFGVHRDITNQKHLEHQLVHAQKMESIGMLAAGLAHEVGNPLTSISSIVQVIQRETKDEFTQDKLELIKSQVTRISRIIRGLVDFSRRSSYEVQLTDVNKCLREAVEIVRVGRKAKEIAFQVDVDENIPKLSLVPDQIQQVFINILINAVDAVHAASMSPGERNTPGKISVRSGLAADNVVVTLEDNGTGIPEEFFQKIFEPFFTTKKVGEGTGLGLWVSYGIIKSFQGNIKVKSVAGEGTTFTVALPLHTELS